MRYALDEMSDPAAARGLDVLAEPHRDEYLHLLDLAPQSTADVEDPGRGAERDVR